MKNTALKIVSLLISYGYDAVIIGGATRDILLGKTPKDVDICTNATSDEVCKIFPNCNTVGASFQVVIVEHDGFKFDVTTYRTESNFDGRHCNVETTNSLEEDCKRRDFTFNAIAYDGLNYIDYFNGIKDLQNNTIKFIGNPVDRINEDNLRLLRFIRIGLQSFDNPYFDKKSYDWSLACMHLIRNLSRERITQELLKIIKVFNFRHFKNEQVLSLLNIMMIELCWNGSNNKMIFTDSNWKTNSEYSNWKAKDYYQNSKYHDLTLDNHIFKVLAEFNEYADSMFELSEEDKDAYRIAILFHDIGKPFVAKVNEKTGYTNYINHEYKSYEMAKEIFEKQFKFTNKLSQKALSLIKSHMLLSVNNDNDILRAVILVAQYKNINIEDLIRFKTFDNSGKKENFDKNEFKEKCWKVLNDNREMMEIIMCNINEGFIAKKVKNKEKIKYVTFSIRKWILKTRIFDIRKIEKRILELEMQE